MLQGTETVDIFSVATQGAEGTAAVAAMLAPHLRPGDAVLLVGGLATGKTTFVKASVHALGSPEPVTSPTFTLAQFYPTRRGTVLHIDAYRLSGIHEYRDLGLGEYSEESVTFVEWGEKVAEDFLNHLMIEFCCDAVAPELRVLTFSSGHDRWRPVIRAMRAGMPEDATLAVRNVP